MSEPLQAGWLRFQGDAYDGTQSVILECLPMSSRAPCETGYELVVDLFAGGGGMSTAIEQALDRPVDIAINHDPDALSMHTANHPGAQHFVADVWEVAPREATGGRPVGLLHLSPDCTEFSQSKGGQPRRKKIRSLSWVGYRWAAQTRPRVITLENVKQILHWGPLVAKRDPATGRVVKLDGSIAAHGERVPVQDQFLVPDPRRRGRTWRQFVRSLCTLGYVVEWRALCAADFGAPTTRERLFLIARCDGEPIRWPAPTHSKRPVGHQTPWRTAAECIDWTILCPSIFDRSRPLAEATLRRIARGIRRYVLESADPFIVPVAHHGADERAHDIHDPLHAITAHPKGGAFASCTPALMQMIHGERESQASRALDPEPPLGTVVAGGIKHRLATAFLAQMNGGFNDARGVPGHDPRRPMSTITNSGSQQQIVTAYLARLRGNCDARDLDDPLMTISAGDQAAGSAMAEGGNKSAPTECALSAEQEASALGVAAFLMRYYGEGGQWSDPRDPMATITTKDRLALVTVTLHGAPCVIVDIGLRMLAPRELYRAQGFPDGYCIDHGHDGRAFSKAAQVRMCGNSVSPPPAAALIRLNMPETWRRAAA